MYHITSILLLCIVFVSQVFLQLRGYNYNNFISIFCVHTYININIFTTILTTLTLIFFFWFRRLVNFSVFEQSPVFLKFIIKARNVNVQKKWNRGVGIIMLQIVVQTVNSVLFFFWKVKYIEIFQVGRDTVPKYSCHIGDRLFARIGAYFWFI